MSLIKTISVDTGPDLVHRVRGLQFFRQNVGEGIASIGRALGLDASFDQQKAADVFVPWIDAVTAQRDNAEFSRSDYIVFSAGLLLKHLLLSKSIVVRESRPQLGDLTVEHEITSFWPEGYLATSYCLTTLDVILKQEGLPGLVLDPCVGELRFWWSFRENFREDPRTAVPFIDLLIGNEPNWNVPETAAARPAIERMLASRPAAGGDRSIAGPADREAP